MDNYGSLKRHFFFRDAKNWICDQFPFLWRFFYFIVFFYLVSSFNFLIDFYCKYVFVIHKVTVVHRISLQSNENVSSFAWCIWNYLCDNIRNYHSSTEVSWIKKILFGKKIGKSPVSKRMVNINVEWF